MGTDNDKKNSNPSENELLEETNSEQEKADNSDDPQDSLPDDNAGVVSGGHAETDADVVNLAEDETPDEGLPGDGELPEATETSDEDSQRSESAQDSETAPNDESPPDGLKSGDELPETTGPSDDDAETSETQPVDDALADGPSGGGQSPEMPSTENNTEADFIPPTDDGVDAEKDNTSGEGQPPDTAEKAQVDGTPERDEKSLPQSADPKQIKKTAAKKLTPLKATSDSRQMKTPAKAAAGLRKIITAAAIVLIVAGYAVYHNPAIVGLGKEKKQVSPESKKAQESAEPVAVQVQTPKPDGKQQLYLSKLNEVDRLRDKLLAKKEEIYRLKLHYRNGISDLQDQIAREMREKGISTLDQALKRRRIELNLRTIQRRQNYIRELEKPDQWVHRGSEELLFLKRKAELDLQMAEIAGGIDMDRHMRYINSAIQKYQPSAEKLAVDPLPLDSTPIEVVWEQIIQKQAKMASSPVQTEDQKIISEICAGNFSRISELAAITPEAARCLSRADSSDLFLNGLTRVTPEDAEYLFQWQGNWICLNGLKELSPAAARYLFKWEGKWISLNGLTEFPPELAVYLMEWKGNQLELMGLKYDHSKPDRKALKYLALWETMGGKLYVSEGIRKEMNRVM